MFTTNDDGRDMFTNKGDDDDMFTSNSDDDDMFTRNGDNHDMFTNNDDDDDMFTSNGEDDDMFRIIQVDCLTKHLQWDASSSTPYHTICHHFVVKFFTTKYSLEDIVLFDDDFTRKATSTSFGKEKNLFFGMIFLG